MERRRPHVVTDLFYRQKTGGWSFVPRSPKPNIDVDRMIATLPPLRDISFDHGR
jgi:hypothetical protein